MRRIVALKVAVWAACLTPLTLLIARGFGQAFGLEGWSLGANPTEEILFVCGKTSLNLLVLTLCITPIRRSTGVTRLITFRRLLGLFAFFYMILHFLTYALLDLRLDWSTLGPDILKRPYITIGFTALLLTIPLAVTSTRGWQRRLGRRWMSLHKLVYVIAVLGVIHYYWQSKLDVSEPLLYAFVFGVLFLARVLHWRETERRRRASIDSKTTMAPTYQRVQPP
jgi:sulfoxide reductase heme-binding subunit YedZ